MQDVRAGDDVMTVVGGMVPRQGRIVIYRDHDRTWPAIVLQLDAAYREDNPEARVHLKVLTMEGDRVEWNVPHSDRGVHRSWDWPAP